MRQDIALESFFKILFFEWIVVFHFIFSARALRAKYPKYKTNSLKISFETEYNLIALIFSKQLAYHTYIN